MLKEELKKIWRPGILPVLAIFGFVFYTMFLETAIRIFPDNYGVSSGQGTLSVTSTLVRKYGTSLSEKNIEKADDWLKELIKDAEQYLKSSSAGKKYKLQTYDDYIRFQEKSLTQIPEGASADQNEQYADCMRLLNEMQGSATDNVDGRIQALRLVLDIWKEKQAFGPDHEISSDNNSFSQKEYEHVKQTFFGKDHLWQNILPWEVPEMISSFTGLVLVWICLSICLLLSPLSVHDRLSRMYPLQYSSRHGRRIVNIQFLSVMLSAFLLTTLNLLLFYLLFARHGTSVFFPCRMYSFLSTPWCWPDWTHGTWRLALTVMCYLISFGVAGVIFFLSRSSANYITLLLKVVPLFAAVTIAGVKIMYCAFYFTNDLYTFTKIPYIEGFCAAGICAAGMALAGYTILRVKAGRM